MTLYIQNGALTTGHIAIDVASEATVEDLIESIINREHETSGIPKDSLRASITLDFSGRQLTPRHGQLSDFGVCAESVVVYNINLYHLEGPFIPKLLHHRKGMDPIEIALQDIDWWIPMNLEGPDLLNAIKCHIKDAIELSHVTPTDDGLHSNVSITFQFINSDSSILEYPPVTDYIGQHRSQWFGRYAITKGTTLHLATTDMIKRQSELYAELQSMCIRISPLQPYAVVIRKALFSQLRSMRKVGGADHGRSTVVLRAKSITVLDWESEPMNKDHYTIQMLIPNGFDVLFDV